MVAYADLILPDTTYLERWDCISLLDRPISGADGPADAIRQPVVAPDRDVRAVPERAARPRRAARSCRASSPTTARRAIPAAIRTTSSTTSAARASARSPAFAARTARATAAARRTRSSSTPTSPNGCFHEHHLAPEQRYYKHANKAYLDWAKDVGFIGAAAPIMFQLYLEPLQKFRLAARGHGAIKPPATHRARIEKYFDPIPFWYPPFDGRARRQRRVRVLGDHAAADAHLSLVGLAQRLDPPDHGGEPPLHAIARARRRSASPTATGSGSRAPSAASRAASG